MGPQANAVVEVARHLILGLPLLEQRCDAQALNQGVLNANVGWCTVQCRTAGSVQTEEVHPATVNHVHHGLQPPLNTSPAAHAEKCSCLQLINVPDPAWTLTLLA